MTKEEKQWVCDKAGFKYVINEGCIRCGNIGRKLSCGHKTVKVFPQIDLNILMQAVFNINQCGKYGIVITMNSVIVNELDMNDKPIGIMSFEEFYYNYKNEASAIKQALIYIKDNE